ncbi:MAG TPA: Na+/H+ antiporter NhaA [Sedimenticola thiotaurini]|uniref:Na(+)/H(+) antiporter NhaA n=1 Tax=Sedimenticola thiotaurini TaxID=1543721 RepID=A0A831RIY4_9GAMM|nr:Na+/H+ antiporter NhaA [Sedimenticola thiotaurini]
MPEQRRLYFAPWERAYERIATPFEEFLHRQTTTGILLIGCAIVALIIANSPLYEAYQHLLHLEVGFAAGSRVFEYSVHHWINDGLMTIFFFVVGLEIKREVLVGELSNIRNAMLPVIAAIGGMVVPALIYVWINAGTDGVSGWGIPMATDIAFAVGVMALLGNRVPRGLLTFLVALAIVDDLGAVTVIALFYTAEINLGYLGLAALITILMYALNLSGIRRALPYFILATFLWISMQGSGIHATIAGIIAAWTIPAYSRYQPRLFSHRMRELLDQFDASETPGQPLINNAQQTGRVWNMNQTMLLMVSPLQKLESALHIPSTYIVIPLFALANAAIPLDLASLAAAFDNLIALGIMAGLVLGKLIGVAGTVILAVKLGIGRLPQGVTPSHIVGAGLLAGIGFTMSIFISELAFKWDGSLVVVAKMGILAASLVAGFGGYAWLRWMTPPIEDEGENTDTGGH